MAGEKSGGGSNYLSLLVPIDRGRGRPEAVLLAKSNLRKYEAIAIPHDEIDFTHAAAIVRRYSVESVRTQVSQRQRFRVLAY